MPINISSLGGAGTHTLTKTNVNLEENYIYYANRDSGTLYPTKITDDSAWIWRETTANVAGVDSGSVYYINSDGFSISFSNTVNGSVIDITEFTPGTVTFNFPYVLNGSLNISQVKYNDRQAVQYQTSGTPITGLTNNEVYYVKNLLTGLGGTGLYDFTSQTFTTGGATGRYGPVVSSVRAAYVAAGATWATTYLNQGSYQGYQDWTVPEDGTYEFNVAGAPGRQGAALGGGGAIVRGRVKLTKNEIITIAVGQRGELPPNNLAWPASSGATFVVRKNGNIPLFVAGAGSSSSNTTNGRNAVLTNTGDNANATGGVSGNGAPGATAGGGGGGFLSSGGNSSYGGGGGGFNNGLVGGYAAGSSSGNGGFGGGAGSDGQAYGAPGGSGGYGGGAAGNAQGTAPGGGGGSYIFPTATNVATSTGQYNESSLFNAAAITNLNLYNTGSNEGSVLVTLVESSIYGFTLHPTAATANAGTSAIAVSANGGSYHALVPVTYDTVNNKINFINGHGLGAGAGLNYVFSGGTAAGPLAQATAYYAEVLDAYTIRLSTTPDPTYTVVDLTTPSANTSTQLFRQLTVNTATETFTIPNHAFLVGQPVRYSNGGGTSITPLVNGATYYVKEVLDINRFTISQSLTGPVLNITSVGTGTNHSFIYTVINEIEDSIYLPSHGFVSGQTVKYTKSRDFTIADLETSGTSRYVSTTVPHGFEVNNRITFNNLSRPAVSTTPIVITQIASSGQTRTLTLASSHNLQTGQFIDVVGFISTRDGRFNGTYMVTGIPTGNTVQYTAEESVTIATENVSEVATSARNPVAEYDENSTSRTMSIRTIESSGTTRTINTNKPHRFTSGYIVTVKGVLGTNGHYFNGRHIITSVPTTNSFTYTGVYEDPARLQVRNPSITIAQVSSSGTANMEMIIDQILSSTRFRYQMPQSSYTHAFDNTATGKTSRTQVRVTSRNLQNRTLGQFTTQSVHGLSIGDRFTVTSMDNTNPVVFNGTYTVTGVPNTTTIQYLFAGDLKQLSSVRLLSVNAAKVNTTTAHNLVSGNYFYINEQAGNNDADYWNGTVNILNVTASGGTSRTVTTDNPHQLSGGDRFILRDIVGPGLTASDWTGDWSVSSVNSATSFNYTATTTFTTAQVSTTAGQIQRAKVVSSVPTYNISTKFQNTSLCDVVLTGNHDLVVGDVIRLENVTGTNPNAFMSAPVSGVAQPQDFTIFAVPAANRITFVCDAAYYATFANEGASGTVTAVNQIRYSIPTSTRPIVARELLSNQVALFTTQYPHNLSSTAAGSNVTISSLSGNNTGVFTGTFDVASTPSATTFTVARPAVVGTNTFTVSTRLRTANVADITLNQTHNLQPGDTVTVTLSTGNPEIFNGSFVISAVPASNRIQYFTLTSGTVASAAAVGDVLLAAVPTASVTGTMTLNSTTQLAKNTAGSTLTVSEVSNAGANGDMSVDTNIPGLINQSTYYVQRIDANTIKLSTNVGLTSLADITGTGIGSQQIVTNSVDYVADTLTIPNHGFTTGELVEYDTQGGTAIGGLVSATPYYIIQIDGNTVKLASSSNNATAGTAINLTPTQTATGTHKLKSLIRTPDGTYVVASTPTANTFTVTAAGQVPAIVKTFSPRFAVDLQNSTVNVPNHGFITGTALVYTHGGGTAVSPLVNSTTYYAIAINRDYLLLASSVEDADNGINIQFTSNGAGLSHTLTSNQINGQITGSGTVSTTQNSVLVSGTGTTFSKILKVGDRFRIFPANTVLSAFFQSSGVNITTNVITVPSHGFTTGDAVVFTPGTGGPVQNIFQISASGNQRTIYTARAHGYSASNVVTVSGLSSTSKSDFEGTFTITGIPNSFQFTYNAANSVSLGVETQTSGIANIAGVTGVAPSPMINNYYYYTRAIPNTDLFTITNRDRTNNLNLYTTSVNHNLLPGNTFTVTGMTGANPEVFNGVFTVAQVPNATQIYAISVGVNIGSAGASGTITPGTSNTITLHDTRADAINNTNIVDISNQGTGSALTLSKITAVAPIVRTVTAVGSDTQITVNRPYSSSRTAASYSYPTFVYVRPQGYALHRPFDGGVEMSTGYGTSYGQIIRQTRKYFRYQSGKGIQTSAAINFKPSIDIESMTRIGNSNSIAIRTRRAHGMANGLYITVNEAKTSTGTLSQLYNGIFQVTVIDSFNLQVISQQTLTETQAYGFPRLNVNAWANGAIRAGMFDFQNGMFYEFDGQKLYAVRRSSTQQIAGTVAALKGSEFVFGTNTKFSAQLAVGDMIVLRGQSYKVSQVTSDTRISIKPEYKGNSGFEKEFTPSTVVDIVLDRFTINSHGFTDNLPLIYNSIDGTPIGGLINGRTYYASVVNNNVFALKSSPTSSTIVSISSIGTGTPHSFTPAKTGIIPTLTVDTKIPQESWNIDPCDGTGPTGYVLDLSRIQMIYMDYSWYGAGKIRFGFKTLEGQVQYVHEFKHNNNLYESYLRSGNLPARYEVVTFSGPTYIPSLFHWGTSVIMDGRFDDDKAYLFSKSSQNLGIGGTTQKVFGSNAISTLAETITITSHGFVTGDALSFNSQGTSGAAQANTQNPQIEVVTGQQADSNLTNQTVYYVRKIDNNTLVLAPSLALANATSTVISNYSKSAYLVTVNTATAHGYSANQSVWTYVPTTTQFSTSVSGSYRIFDVPSSTQYRYYAFVNNRDFGTVTPAASTSYTLPGIINFTSVGNTQANYILAPSGTLNNTSGANYQPLLSIRLSPSVSEGLTGELGDRDIINRMQLSINEVGIQTNQLVDVKILLNPRLNNLNFSAVSSPSLTQVIEHTSNDTVSGGIQVYSFRAAGASGTEQTTTVDVSELFELSNSILGGGSIFPDGPDIVTIAVARLTGTETLASAKLSWREAQA